MNMLYPIRVLVTNPHGLRVLCLEPQVGKIEVSPASCPLISTYMTRYMCTYTQTHICTGTRKRIHVKIRIVL